MKPWSLARRLGLFASLGVLLLAVGAALVLGRAFESALQRGLDLRLQGWLDTLAAAIERDPQTGTPQLPRALPGEGFERVFSGEYWQVQHAGAVLVSPSLWDSRLPLDTQAPVAGSPRYLEVQGPLQQRLRLAQLRILLPAVTAPVDLAVAVDLAALDAESQQFRWLLWLALAGLGISGMLLLWLQLRLGLAPLRGLTLQLRAIAAGKRRRLALNLGPDLAPVADQLHAVLDQQTRIVQRARAQAQDLAHALKTPLSVLRADLLQLPEPLASNTRRQLDLMGRHLDRYLGEAHAQAQPVVAAAAVPLAPVVAELCAMFARVHRARALSIRTEVPGTLVFAGELTDLQEVLGNLLDNGFRHARQQVSVSAATVPGAGGRITITIDDDGPGLSPNQMWKALQRGERLDTRQPGSGLGLDIVQRIAASYGGSLNLAQAPLGGLRAHLQLPGGAAEA